MLVREYGPAWITFREYSQENSFLLNCLRFVLNSGPSLKENFDLIDVGCGDASLTCALLSENVLGFQPGNVYLSEPLKYLYSRAYKVAQGHLGPLRIPYKIHLRPLRHLRRIGKIDRTGLILSVHSSYYFNQSDLTRLLNLRQLGYGILVLENDNDCWVSQVMHMIGNTRHPQFNNKRFTRLLRVLNVNSDQVSRINISASLSLPSDDFLKKMFGFFAYQHSNPQYNEARQLDRLYLAFQRVLSQDPAFSYRIAYCPSL